MRLSISIVVLALIMAPLFSSAQCNGQKNLCYKRYSDVAFLITNHSFTPFEDLMVADQSHPIGQQLQNKVDGLQLNVTLRFGQPVVFYRSPLLGTRPLLEVLAEVRNALREDPTRVLTLIFDSEIPNSQWVGTIEKSGLDKYLYVHNGGDWPVLRDMIDPNHRLVLFANNVDKKATPRLHDLDAIAMRSTTDLCKTTCNELLLGADGPRDLLVLDHHMELKVSEKIDDLVWVNSRNVLFGRAIQCWDRTGHIPNFVLVDHYQIGETLEAITMINSITDGLAENVDPRNFEIMKDPIMDYSTIDFRGFIRKDHKLEIWEEDGMQVASVENAEYAKMYIPKMALAFGSYKYRILDPNNEEILKGQFHIN